MATFNSAITQNTVGNSEGLPVGVPTSYSWYSGAVNGAAAPPSNFTAVTGWGQIYQEAGKPTYSNPNAHVQVENAETYVHLKSTGEWILVQNQDTNQIAGGHYVSDFAGDQHTSLAITKNADGSVFLDAPPSGYNDHFWPTARGTYQAGDVDAVYVQMDMRVTDPNLHLIANVGADWWRDAGAPFVDGFGNNPGAGMSNWVELTTEWKSLSFYSSSSVFKADPPPTLVQLAPPTPVNHSTDPGTAVADPGTGGSAGEQITSPGNTGTDPGTPGTGVSASGPGTNPGNTGTDPGTSAENPDTPDTPQTNHARGDRHANDLSGTAAHDMWLDALVETNHTHRLDALLAKASAWDMLHGQHAEGAPQSNTGLAEITEPHLAWGSKPAAPTSEPVQRTAVEGASAHVDHWTGLTAQDHYHHNIFWTAM